MLNLNPEDLDALQQQIMSLPESERDVILESLDELARRKYVRRCQADFLRFCLHMMPDYKVGAHHRQLSDLLMSMEKGEQDRIAVSIPPRHGKSQLVSIFFPAWYLGKNPNKQVLLVSHTGELAVDFGRKIRNLVDSDAYREIFPDVGLSADSKSAGRWNTSKGGTFYACGVGSALAGRGADFLIVDDPFSEQDILNGNYEVFEKAYEWFTYGARTRLMPKGRVAIVHTRWAPEDLIGRLAKDMDKIENSDQYHFFEFPAIFNENSDNEKALWPEFFDLEALHRTKASMPVFQWNAQYQQTPTSEEGALIKRDWWRIWPHEEPPDCEYIIMALDAAAETKNRSDYTAILTLGVFRDPVHTNNAAHLILLNAVNRRVEFHQLKELAMDEYMQWRPDAFIVEKKSSGTPLFQELRRQGIPVSEFTPHRGTGDKIARINAVSDIVQSGMVWKPVGLKWAEEVVEQVAAFPSGAHDDLVDCLSMALARFRNGGFIRLPTDEEVEDDYESRRAAYY